MPACPKCQSSEHQRERTAYGDWSRCLKCRACYAPTPNTKMPAEPNPKNALNIFQATHDEVGRHLSWQAPSPKIYLATGGVTALFGGVFLLGGVWLGHWSYALIGLLFGGLMLWGGLTQLRKGRNTHQISLLSTGKISVKTGPWPHQGYPFEAEPGSPLFCRCSRQERLDLFDLYAQQNGKAKLLTPAELESKEQAFWLLYHCQNTRQI